MAFDFKSWLKTGLIDGYKQSSFSMPHVTTMTANYIMAGMLTNEDAAEIAEACAEFRRDAYSVFLQLPQKAAHDAAGSP